MEYERDVVPRALIVLLVEDGDLDEAIQVIQGVARTDHRGDLVRVLAGQRRRTLAVVVSDFHEARSGIDALALLRARGLDVVVVHVVEAADAELPLGAALTCEDAETGARLKVDVTPELLEALRGTWRRRARRLEGWCVARGIQHHRVDVRTPLWDVLPRLLGVGWGRRRA